MNCGKCQELLSDFLDGTLNGTDQAMLGAHLDDCMSCADVRSELAEIVGFAQETRGELVSPPNERAMWLRIRNTIESEDSFRHATVSNARVEQPQAGFLSRLFNKRWELTLPQMATSVAAIAVAVALVTTLGVQRLTNNVAVRSDNDARSGIQQQQGDAMLVGSYPHSYVEPQQANINYWQGRVQQRKANWNPRMRDSFERSLVALDEAVNESLGELRQNPHDEVAEEMLNSALRDKMELLREFGDQ